MATFAVGDVVQANWKDSGSFYGGKIATDNGDGTYDVAYDDGDFEAAVSVNRIQPSKAAPACGGMIGVGDVVKANWKNSGSFYGGKITKDNGDDTYDVAYDDGDFEAAVPAGRIQVTHSASPTPADSSRSCEIGSTVESGGSGSGSSGGVYAVGSKVDAVFCSSGYFYKAVVIAVDGNKFDVRFEDDGKEEKGVEPFNIRPRQLGPDQKHEKAPAPTEFVEGEFVLAEIGSDGCKSKARVVGSAGVGKFFVLTQDGLTTALPPTALERHALATEFEAFVDGAAVSVNKERKGVFVAGKISKVCGSDVYDITYDDSSSEEGVHAFYICAAAAASSSSGGSESYELTVGYSMKAVIRGSEVFSQSSARIGYFESSGMYSSSNSKLAYFSGETLYISNSKVGVVYSDGSACDHTGSPVGRISDGIVTDRTGSRLGVCNSPNVGLVAAIFFFGVYGIV